MKGMFPVLIAAIIVWIISGSFVKFLLTLLMGWLLFFLIGLILELDLRRRIK